MASAVLDTVSYDVECNGYMFKASSSSVKSRGYMVLYEAIEDDLDEDEKFVRLPSLKKDEILSLDSMQSTQRFTEPPQRYTEATLIKFLEENGIGRPSTYAPIISIIISRNYVRREGKMLVATPLGEVTTKFMREHFPEIVDYEFTAQIEKQLDSIENRDNTIVGVIGDFYKRFEEELKNAGENHKEEKVDIPDEKSEVICDRCGSVMVYKNGRYGRFLACPNYPECKNTKAIDKSGNPVDKNEPKAPQLAGFKCDVCGSDMVVREGKFGAFYACINYPTCKNTKQKTSDTGVACPKCGGKILARHGKGKMLFYSCENYPECDFSTWDMPLKEKCPVCGDMLCYRINRKQVVCKSKDCAYKREEEMTVIE
jgi:DNA topoisomerase-1